MNSSRPLLSVVMPLFNHERYVEAAVHSVLAQSYDNLELIIIDDASTDQSAAKATAFKEDRIRIILHPRNVGASATINEGISFASGEYVSIINSDDVYAPGRLETLYLRCVNEGVSLAGTGMILIDDNGNTIGPTHWWRLWYDDLVKCYVETKDLYFSLLRGNFFISSSNFFFRKSLFDQIGSFQPLRYVHDYEYVLRALNTPDVRVAFYDDEPLLQYRLHSSNSIHENVKEANRETFDVLITYGAQQHSRDPMRVYSAVLTHLQRIRHHIEESYEVEHAKYQAEQEALCAAIKDELTNRERNLDRANTEIDRLRNEVSRISATRGYRLEKQLYNIYLKLKNFVRNGAGA